MALDVNTVANVATAGTLIVAVTFGIIQVRQAERDRQAAASGDFVRTLLTPDLTRALKIVFELPDAAPADLVRGTPATMEAALYVIHTWETTGWMAYRRLVGVEALDEVAGGYARRSWVKLRPLIEDERKRARSPNVGEWFQWLVERLDDHPLPWKAQGAHVALRAWRR